MKEAYTTTALLFLGADGILRVKIREGAVINLADAKNHFRVTHRLLEGKKGLVLVDARTHYSATVEARSYTSRLMSETCIATALLISSKAASYFSNFYMNIAKPGTSLRVFTDEEEALRWLLTFRK